MINEHIFKDIFCSNFSGDVPYINETWPNDFEVSLEAVKIVIAEDNLDLSDLVPCYYVSK